MGPLALTRLSPQHMPSVLLLASCSAFSPSAGKPNIQLLIPGPGSAELVLRANVMLCSQADMPLIYANEAFARITGYSVAESLGKNCRFLQVCLSALLLYFLYSRGSLLCCRPWLTKDQN